MTELDINLQQQSLNFALSKRRKLLRQIGWLSVMAWPVLTVTAYFTRPLEYHAIVGLTAVSLMSLVWMVMGELDKKGEIYQHARVLIGVYMIALVLQTANVLFGSTEWLYLQGQPPLVLAGYQITVILAYVMLDKSTAMTMTRWFYGSLALLIIGHTALRWQQFESYYALAWVLTTGIMLLPGTHLLLKMYIETHMEALIDASEQQAYNELALEHIRQEQTVDSVTGMINRQDLEQKLQEMLQGDGGFGVLVFKLNDQEKMRNRLGDSAYEAALKITAESLAEWVQDKNRVARREGSELVVWSRHIHSQEALESAGAFLIQKIRQLGSQHKELSELSFRVAGSISKGHQDSNFLLEEISFRLFMAKLRPDNACYDA